MYTLSFQCVCVSRRIARVNILDIDCVIRMIAKLYPLKRIYRRGMFGIIVSSCSLCSVRVVVEISFLPHCIQRQSSTQVTPQFNGGGPITREYYDKWMSGNSNTAIGEHKICNLASLPVTVAPFGLRARVRIFRSIFVDRVSVNILIEWMWTRWWKHFFFPCSTSPYSSSAVDGECNARYHIKVNSCRNKIHTCEGINHDSDHDVKPFEIRIESYSPSLCVVISSN